MTKLYRSLFFGVGVALLVAGCASGPQYKEVAASIPTLSADQGRIYFIRSSSMEGAMLQPEIKLNSEVVGHSQVGGFFFVDKPAGQYTVSIKTEVEKTVSFALTAGQTRYVRSSVSMGFLVGHVAPMLEDSEEASEEVKDLKYTGVALTK
jgi:hypothetical protein